jgi:16S rRNA (cytosine1402-N4)-methyltransferase
MSGYHTPVLLKESVDGLNITPGGIYVDVTYGGGGHSLEILKRMKTGKLCAIDQDEEAAIELPDDKRFIFIRGNFRYLTNYMKYYGIKAIDGLLADLGVSSHHFDVPERGFTYRADTKLDMRMNRNGKLTAEIVINEYDSDRLTSIFREYGELHQAHKLTAAIIQSRQKQRIVTTRQLISCIEPLIPRQIENQYLSKVFQAIRIEVNHELESLEEMMISALGMLNSGGRLVIISYHSLEDRLVKNFMRWGNTREQPVKDLYGNSYEPFRIISRKPLMAGDEEIKNNPRARSARLRIAEKK